MSKSSTKIKSIIAPNQPCYAAFLSDPASDIDWKITPIVCWSLVSFADAEDEVIGQIAVDDAILEVSYVDEENGFGNFLGYFFDESEAKAAILATLAEKREEEEDDDEEDEEDDEEEQEEDDNEEDEEDDD